MKKKKDKNNTKQELMNLLKYRIKTLQIEQQLYEQNPTLMKNIKIANVELIQGDLATLRKLLSDIA